MPPADFLEAYELLCEVLYYGSRLKPEDAGKVTGSHGQEFWFGDDTLLEFKAEADRLLAGLRSELRKWAAARTRARPRRPAPEGDRRGDLARARGEGHPGPDVEDEEA